MTEKRLTAEVLAILSKPFAVEDHELRDGGRDGKLVYITEEPLLDRLTEADPDWEFDIVKSDVVFPGDGPAFVRELGRLTICGVSRVSSGTGFANMREYGYDNGKRFKLDTPVILPLSETEAKGATTDTLKRCARLFRVGAYLLKTKGEKFQNDADFQRWYVRMYGKPETPMPPAHVRGADQARSVVNQGGAQKSSPARPKNGQETDSDPLEAITWTRDKARLSKLVDWAENEWQLDSRAHTINRLAKALGIQGTPNGDFNLFADMMAAQYTQSDADAMKAVKLYESAKPTPGAELFPREDDAGNVIETGACVDCGKPTDRRAVDGTWRCEACATTTAKKRKAG